MFFRQFYDTSLAQASYLIGCQATGEAIVIDPTRDVEPYVRVAEQERLRIVAVTETHIHADFVSGSRELYVRTGARMLLSAEGGEDWQYAFAHEDNAQLLHDGDSFLVGNIRFDVLHTPGHTPEHLSFIVTDTPAAAGPMGIITGDFVFVGDVGRPDLLERAAHYANTMEASARVLFHSLQRFRALADHLQVWPGHGAGSACGKALGAVPFTTVGYERLANWALNIDDEAVFVREVLAGQPEPPKYFATMKRINKAGPRVLRGFPTPPKLPAAAVYGLVSSGALVLDLRPAATFAAEHVPGTLSIPLNKSLSTWAGWLVEDGREFTLLLNTDTDSVNPPELQQAVRDLAMVGLDSVTGWLDQHALAAYVAAGGELESVAQISPAALVRALADGSVRVIDVRGASEWADGHIAGSINIPVGLLGDALDELPPGPIVLHCQLGARSAIAASVLHRAGRRDVQNMSGGIEAWMAQGLPVSPIPHVAATAPSRGR